LNKYFKVGFI